MQLSARINASSQLRDLPIDAERIHRFDDLIPITATPGLAITAGIVGAAVAGSEIGKNAD